MQIERINNNLYDKRGQYKKLYRARNQKVGAISRQPIDAFVFDFVPEKSSELPVPDHSFLKAYIDALPDEEINRRMKDLKLSNCQIDDSLVEKLIMEEL